MPKMCTTAVGYDRQLSGYFNPGYIRSLGGFGQPLLLPRSRAAILKREIEDSGLSDAMGGYPIFCCPDWSELDADLKSLHDQLVSIVVAPDPISSPSIEGLSTIFDYVEPYKVHYVVRTGQRPETFVNPRHRQHALKALRCVKVEVCDEPWRLAGEFDTLFGTLASRHTIRGLRRFSKEAFEQQFALPGLVMFRATANGNTIGLDTWYVQDDCAQGHLSALDNIAYDMHAAYAIKWRVLEYFNDKVEFINLGGGRSMDGRDGLSVFKRGWANDSCPSWICGRILQPQHYIELTAKGATSNGPYFPAYRRGEFD